MNVIFDSQDSVLTKDYPDSTDQRFQPENIEKSLNYKNLSKPSQTLHFSNLPENIKNIDDLKNSVFQQNAVIISHK